MHGALADEFPQWKLFFGQTFDVDFRKIGGLARNRTGMQGFAVLCVTTPPRGLIAGGLYAMLLTETTVAREFSKIGVDWVQQLSQNCRKLCLILIWQLQMYYKRPISDWNRYGFGKAVVLPWKAVIFQEQG